MLSRPALVRWLSEAIVGSSPARAEENFSSRLVLLQAPAGYGKTTLLADFARATTIPCCWYVMDRSDTDTLLFLETLLTSIRQHFPFCGTVLDPLLTGVRAGGASQPAEHRFDAVAEAVVDAIASEISEHFVLILCNYHEVDACPSIHRLIDRLLHVSSSCVLVLESRSLPTLDIAPLLARREMAVMNRDRLRLNAQEIQGLARLQDIAPLNDVEAEKYLVGNGIALMDSNTATTVRVRNGKTLLTQGPVASTKEQYCGHYLLNCRDINEAVEVAGQILSAKNGAIEVRPIIEFGPPSNN